MSQPLYEVQTIELRGDHWCATVFVTLPDDAVPEGMHIPSMRIVLPICPLGKPFEQVQREAIRLAQGCIQEDGLLAAVRHHP